MNKYYANKYYTTKEDAILRAHYPGGGAAACRELLPHRSCSSISKHAKLIGLRMGVIAWTPEKTEQLRWLTAQSMSAREIADVLGISRNAVIGKWRRLGLCQPRRPSSVPHSKPKAHEPQPQRHSTMRLVKAHANGTLRVVETPSMAPMEYHNDGANIPAEQRKTLFDLQHGDCRWPCGDPATPTFFFCGGPAADGKSYCWFHCSVAFNGIGRSPDRWAWGDT